MAEYEVEVLVNRKPIKQFRHKGDTFVEGRKGTKFELRFTNNTWKRIEVVPSVDGLSIIDGKPSGSGSEGYIVPMRDSITIPGWRLSNDAVAEFVFNDKERSYTNQMGHGKANSGVIGFMVFEELSKIDYFPSPYPYPDPWIPVDPWEPIRPRKPWRPWDYDRWPSRRWGDVFIGNTTAGNPKEYSSETVCDSSNPLIGSGCTEESSEDSERTFKVTAQNAVSTTRTTKTSKIQLNEVFELGTGWGDELEHKVTLVEFSRRDDSNPDEILVIYYDTRKGLENRGIRVIQTKKKRVKKLPSPFPTYSESGATPPPGWKNRKR